MTDSDNTLFDNKNTIYVTTAPNDTLIVVDVQNDFMPGGALAVPYGHEVVPIINRVSPGFDRIIITQDWHPPGHVSFASTHNDLPFLKRNVGYGDQTMWPDHCVRGTQGAELHPGLIRPTMELAELIVRKGRDAKRDSYSAFIEADRHTHTGLHAYLTTHKVKRVFIAGPALDYCVAATAIDAANLGYETYVVLDACRAVSEAAMALADDRMRYAGVRYTRSTMIRTYR